MKAYKKQLVKLAAVIAVHLVLILTVRSVLAQAYKIPSGSMEPTLKIGDHILVNKLAYGIHIPFTDEFVVRFQPPLRGEVIVFIFPEDSSKDFIKRVVGTPGDLVEIRDKKILINGRPLAEPYLDTEGTGLNLSLRQATASFGPVQVPDGKLFVLGDNRDRSYDSRFWGFVDVDDVKGRAALIYWSKDRENNRVRWERIGKTIS